jgi:hypothetical protein
VASRAGIPSISLDINPVMATFAAAKSRLVLDHDEEIDQFFEDLVHFNEPAERAHVDESLTNIFDEDTARLIRAVVDAIPTSGHLGDIEELIDPTVVSSVRDVTQIIHPVYAFYMATIFVTLRELSGTITSKNPTWLRASETKITVRRELLLGELRRHAANMLADLRAFFGRKGKFVSNYSLAGDARVLPIKDGAVDRVITSPPYLTRIDYAMSTIPELSLFGSEDLLTFVRHRTMGAPVITKNGKYQKDEWGSICNSVLDGIKSHETKAASSYYWKNIVQYFIDMDAALEEIIRVMKPGGSGLIVVQSSYFKDLEIPLGEIYKEMASIKGLKSEIAYREEVRNHMAHVNTKSTLYKAGKVYYEDFVHIQRPLADIAPAT